MICTNQTAERERKRQQDIRFKIRMLQNAIANGRLDTESKAELARLKSALC